MDAVKEASKLDTGNGRCPFCCLDEAVLVSNELAFAVEDICPAAPGHCLVIPRRHIETMEALQEREVLALFRLVKEVKELVHRRYRVDGFNIGINIGEMAGQTIHHIHIHIIPRRCGDVSNPRGGIRKVLPSRRQGGNL